MVITEWFYNNPISILSKRAETLNIVINSKLSRACPTEQNIFTIQTSKIVLFLFLQHRFDFPQRLGNNAEWWTWGDMLVTNRIPLSTCRFSHHLSDLNASQNRIKSVDSVITDWLHSIRGDGYQSLLRGPAYPLRSQSRSVPYLNRGLPNLFSQEFCGITFHKTLSKWQVNDDISPALLR